MVEAIHLRPDIWVRAELCAQVLIMLKESRR